MPEIVRRSWKTVSQLKDWLSLKFNFKH
jgi:hypothetical protein